MEELLLARKSELVAAFDPDGDGFVDQSAYYQVIGDNQFVTLKSKAGMILSHETSKFWDAIKAVHTNQGCQVLIAGTGRRQGFFAIAAFTQAGELSGLSGWKSEALAMEAGWDSYFNIAFGARAGVDTTAVLPVGRRMMGIANVQQGSDWYSLGLEAGTQYVFQIHGIGLRYPKIIIRNQYGAQIGGNLETWSASCYPLEFTPEYTGRYFLEVGSGYPVSSIYNDDNEDAETYTVSVSELNENEGALPEVADTISVGDEITGIFDYLGDVDWFKVRLPSASYYKISHDVDHGDVTLFDRNLNPIFSVRGDGYDYFPLNAGTYYINVENAYNYTDAVICGPAAYSFGLELVDDIWQGLVYQGTHMTGSL